ncbi:DUF3054 domain-containing protein [Haloplanus rubicundus]|uniref:DUF3054 domain-containing protein n=1 Tax=Haloplanus rubicundus TaxID=1547898 RepID=A0A345E6H8_9EURY|nr:DUF3054 domain-containing protein [Haloplanus rubicundus]AXG07800.1 DUF3054 domain-containing protein [Haloplanus rubicundus]AXG11217.1 DUF3054 domain-containing protein [Haloplanus rubicundus]
MANAVANFFDRRLDGRAAPLAIGDLFVVALLFSWGTIHHNGLAFVASNPGYLAGTIAPFVIGWVIAAPLLGAYSPGAAESAKAAVPLALRSWLLADAIALGLRATPFVRGGVQLSFVLISLGVGFVGLALWRTLFFKLR